MLRSLLEDRFNFRENGSQPARIAVVSRAVLIDSTMFSTTLNIWTVWGEAPVLR